ncbi:Putative TM nitroreductase [Lachnospiraceae bacterium YSD2013]|nr:Putative TM nitroreductase [Lachnospiraceae bacterium YSD2013]
MTDKQAILVRHSVRKYRSVRIADNLVAQLKAKIDELNAAGNLHLQFVEDAGKAYGNLIYRAVGLISAPSIIVCVGEDTADLDERVGYYGEKLVLFAQTLGLNTCWTGTFNRKAVAVDVKPGERVVLAIAIGYGVDQGKDRKSKTYEQVTEVAGTAPDWFKEGVKAALLAPTALNEQKFMIKYNADDTVSLETKGGGLTKIDLGIVKCHFEIGAGREF